MVSNYKANDPYINEQVDLDDIFVSDAWLVDQFVGGTLFGCGYNGVGTLGDGTINPRSSPVQVGNLINWKQVACGYTTLSVKTDGTLWGWGYGNYGSLGNGSLSHYSSPIQIGSLTNWKQIDVGRFYWGAIKTDGTLWTCGYNGSYGPLGTSNVTTVSSPVQVGLLTNWKQVACASLGTSGMAAIKTDGTLWSWGAGSYGQLGNGTTVDYSSPVQVGLLTTWKQVSRGTLETAAIKTDGTLWMWGYNAYGELGNGTTISYSSPIQIGSLTTWKQVACGYGTAAIKTDGTLWTWGRNNAGQLGNGTTINYSSPIQVGSLTNWKQIDVGPQNPQHMAAIKTDGTLWTWGSNLLNGLLEGQLGTGTTGYYSSPVQVGSLTNWKQVTCGIASTIAITFRDLG